MKGYLKIFLIAFLMGAAMMLSSKTIDFILPTTTVYEYQIEEN